MYDGKVNESVIACFRKKLSPLMALKICSFLDYMNRVVNAVRHQTSGTGAESGVQKYRIVQFILSDPQRSLKRTSEVLP